MIRHANLKYGNKHEKLDEHKVSDMAEIFNPRLPQSLQQLQICPYLLLYCFPSTV